MRMKHQLLLPTLQTNHAPQITTTKTTYQTQENNTSFTVDINASDEDNDSLTLSISGVDNNQFVILSNSSDSITIGLSTP